MTNSRLLTLEDVIQLTLRDGEAWALSHARRLITLTAEIGRGLSYDADALALAVYLHDWGAFACHARKGVEHALRSRQVAEAEILPRMALPAGMQTVVLEAVELHDYRDPRPTRSLEALLLREADMLEFLGAVGIARDFARGPRDLQACAARVDGRVEEIRGRFSLPRAQELAGIRLERMEQFRRWLDEESFNVLN